MTPDSEKLTIAWTAPTDTGTSAIKAYGLRYIETSADETVDANWTVRDNAWTSGDLEYTIPNLTDGTAYDVQVRAVNDDGDGPWSDTAVGTPVASSNTAPGIHSLRADDGALSVAWTAPTDTGGATTTVYDVRYIETSADESVDANWTVRDDAWTSGELRYAVTGLENGVSYDVQVRAVNDGTDGPWSGAATGAPSDHCNTLASATTILPDTRVWGSITVGDEDYFELELSRETGVWIYTTGDIDTVGDLLDDSGLPIDSNDDGNVLPNPENFFIWRTLAPGTYYIKVSGYESAGGTYALSTRPFTDTSSRSNAAELKLGGSASGMLDPEFDEDYFKLVLSEDADVIIRSSGFPDTTGSLLDSGGDPIAFNDDGYLPNGIRNFLIGQTLKAGTYYLRVAGFAEDTGPYTIYATAATEPGSTVAAAQPLALGVAAGGSIDAADDVDYFSITVTEPTYVAVRTVSDTIYLDGALLDSNSSPVQPDFVQGAYRTITFTIRDRLDPGTYYVKVTGATSTDIGIYNIMAIEETGYVRFLDRCSDIETSAGINDALYGCQWHLSNTGQFPGGAWQDINVEEVWAGGTRGAGINVAVVDDGMHHGHEDLQDNVNASLNYDYTGRNDIYDTYEDHGTAVAGIIAARNNSIGMRGVAPMATIYGYNLLLNHTELNEANAMFLNATTTAVSNNSWGTPDIFTIGFANSLWEAAVEYGVSMGFHGKGIFYVWAAGNGGDDGDYGDDGDDGDDSNLDEYTNHHAVTAVCAVNHADVRTSYSELGSNLWVCAPSNDTGMPGIATTDNGNRYRGDFGGTSAATPIVSGVAALVRDANEALTWRDVKLILAASARKNDEDDSGWEQGALKYGSDAERYNFNHEYGFGVVDAKAAVDLARSWTNVPPLRQISATSADSDVTIPDATSNGAGATVTSTVTIASYVEFTEFVEVNAHFDHSSFRDLDVELVSPSGAVSKLSPPSVIRSGAPLTSSFRFGSAKHLGEDAAGVWTLRITDHVTSARGTLRSWEITVYGHGSLPGSPEIATVTPGGGTLTIDWTAPTETGESAVTSFDLRYIRADAPDRSATRWTMEQQVGSLGDPRYVLAELQGDIEYDLQVRAVNSEGPGPWSKAKNGKPDTNAPAAPSIRSITPGDRALAVVWTAPNNIGGEAPTSYDLRHIETSADETVDSNWTVVDRAWTGGALRYTIAGLANGTQYDIQVRAVNSAGDGAWSTTSTGTPTQAHVPVTLSWEQAALTVGESDGTVTLRAVAVTTAAGMPQSGFSFDVTVTTKDDSAAQHSDYNALSDTATFSAGDFTQVTVNGQQRYRAEKEFELSVNDDTIDEPDESFTVTLDYLNSRPTHLQGGNSTARVTITDDDHVPVTLGWEQAAVTVNEGTGTVTLRAVALTTKDKMPDTGFSFDVSVATSDATASRPDDYILPSDTLTFTQSEFRRTTINGQRRYRAVEDLTLTIVDDTEDEPDESFTVTMAYSDPTLLHLQGGPVTAAVTIADNDQVPITIAWEQGSHTVDEDVGDHHPQRRTGPNQGQGPGERVLSKGYRINRRRQRATKLRLPAVVHHCNLPPGRLHPGGGERRPEVSRRKTVHHIHIR